MKSAYKNFFIAMIVVGSTLSAEACNSDITPEMEYEFLTLKEISDSITCSDIDDSIAIHTLSNISANHHILTLTDGSEWKIGIFWRGRLSTWCQNDQLRFTLHLANTFNLVKIENLNQHSVVWGNLHRRSDIETVDVRWIVDTFLDSFVELNDGSIFQTNRDYSPIRSGWGPGNMIFLLSNQEYEYPYVLWNLTWDSIIPSELYSPPIISN